MVPIIVEVRHMAVWICSPSLRDFPGTRVLRIGQCWFGRCHQEQVNTGQWLPSIVVNRPFELSDTRKGIYESLLAFSSRYRSIAFQRPNHRFPSGSELATQ